MQTIDWSSRRSLSVDIRRLVTGRMTNDEFDDVYFERYEACDDPAVAAIASYCYCLYDSATLYPIKLHGRHAVPRETRQAAARAVLFLRAGLAYEWPKNENAPLLLASGRALAAPHGIIAGILLLVIGIPVYLVEPYPAMSVFPLLGILITLVSLAVLQSWRNFERRNQAAFEASGDPNLWPFSRQSDLQQAKRTAYLLGRQCVDR